MTIVKCYTRVVSTTVSKIFMLANTEIFIFAYGHEFRQFLRMTHIRPCYTHGMTDSTFFFKMKPNLIWHKQNIINFWQYIGLHNAKDLRWFNLKYIRFICTCRNCFRISPRVQHMPMLNGILPTQRHRYRKDFFVFSLKLIIKTFCLLVLTIYTAIMQLCTL